MNNIKTFLLLSLIFLTNCKNTTDNSTDDTYAAAITKILNEYLQPAAKQPVHSILVNLKRGPSEYQHAVGMADGLQEKVAKDFQFRIASITKIFTATLVLQLIEEDHFQLDDSIYDFLKEDDFIKKDSLHLFENTNYTKSITIRQLLQHRSGLSDFYDDMATFVTYMEQHKKSNWTAQDLFAFYYLIGLNKKAHFKPGDEFHYSDVNYLLLTKLIEKVTDMPVAVQYRKRFFQSLAMEDTYYEYYEQAVGIQKMAHTFYLSEDINKSGRWSGGGFISTTKDLTIFIEALLKGQLFKKATTLAQMMEMPSSTKKYKYGMGLKEITIAGKKYYGHSGFWGSHILHCPANQETICISINQAISPFDRMQLIKEILSMK